MIYFENVIHHFSASVSGSFQMAGLGKLNCSESNGESISGQSECETAANKLGIVFAGARDSPEYPNGCFKQMVDEGNPSLSEYMFWNALTGGAVGAAQSDASPICKVGGNHDF